VQQPVFVFARRRDLVFVCDTLSSFRFAGWSARVFVRAFNAKREVSLRETLGRRRHASAPIPFREGRKSAHETEPHTSLPSRGVISVSLSRVRSTRAPIIRDFPMGHLVPHVAMTVFFPVHRRGHLTKRKQSSKAFPRQASESFRTLRRILAKHFKHVSAKCFIAKRLKSVHEAVFETLQLCVRKCFSNTCQRSAASST